MAAMENNKIRYGLKNVHIFPIESVSDTTITYGQVFKLPGAVSLSMDPSGDSNSFYADDVIYHNEFINNGYEGELEIAMINEDFETKILGCTKDENGAIIENVNATSKNFALTFEFKGDKKRVRHILYNVSASRPKFESATKEEKTKINTDKIKFKAIPDPKGQIKAKQTEGSKGYETFYTKVYSTKEAAMSV